MPRMLCFIVVLMLLAGCAGKQSAPPGGGEDGSRAEASTSDAQDLVSRAAETVRVLRAESELFDVSVQDAEAVLIFPSYFRIGYLASLGGAKGVLLMRDRAGFWSAPSFHSMGQLGGGLQIGLEYGSIVYLVNDASLVPDLAKGRWQLDASAAVVVLNRDDRRQVTEMTDDLRAVLFTDMDGVFAGVAVDGAYVDLWQRGMDEFHGPGLTAAEVVLEGQGNRDGGEILLEALTARPHNR